MYNLEPIKKNSKIESILIKYNIPNNIIKNYTI